MNAGIALLHAPVAPAAEELAGTGKHRGANGDAAFIKSDARFFKSDRQHALVQVPIRH
jgi:hypothetical protein